MSKNQKNNKRNEWSSVTGRTDMSIFSAIAMVISSVFSLFSDVILFILTQQTYESPKHDDGYVFFRQDRPFPTNTRRW